MYIQFSVTDSVSLWRPPSKRITFYSVSQQPAIEVDQQTDLLPRGAKIGENLRLEQGIEPIDTLDLDNNGILHKQVEPVLTYGPTLVDCGNHDLSLICQARIIQLNTERGFVTGLQEPGSELSMDLDGTADDCFRDIVQLFHSVMLATGAQRHGG